MSFIITLLILILMLGVLIFVHELGHYLAAKWSGVYVHEFALGMGPKIFSFKRKNKKGKKKDPTLYSLRAFPIGGFCHMAGQVDEEDEMEFEGKTHKEKKVKIKKDEFFCNKSKWQRFLILFSGVALNFALAFLLLFLQALIWGHSELKSYVGHVLEDYPMAEAGIVPGDRIMGVNGRQVRNWDKLQIVLNLKNAGTSFDFEVLKTNGTTQHLEITPATVEDDDGTERKMFGFSGPAERKTGIINSLDYAVNKMGALISSMGLIIGSLFTGNLSMSALAGPVGMFGIVGNAARHGMENLVFLTAYLSINLGFINSLPFPAFDGGRIIFIIIEAITRRKVSANIEGTLHMIGFILLMLLMIYITVMDVIRLF